MRFKNQYQTIQENQRFSSLGEELGCPSHGVSICGRVASIRSENVHLEEELNRTKNEREMYRVGFETLLGMLNKSLRQDFVIETLKQRLRKIDFVKSVYCLQRKNILAFSVYMEKEDWAVEDQIFDIYGDLLDRFPELDIKLRVLRLWGRKAEEMSLFGGTKIFG